MSYGEYEVTVNGIPAIAIVTSHYYKRGSFSPMAVCPEDYYGYDEMEFELKDRKGYPKQGDAQWLVNIAEEHGLWEGIEQQIRDAMEAEHGY